MRICVFSAALLTAGLCQAATPVNGWYSSVFGGYTYIAENVTRTYNGLVWDDPTWNSGYNAGARIGFQSNPLRYEAEFTYLNAQLKYFALNDIRQFNASGSTTAAMIMANIYYDFPDMVPAISPFIGLGIGYDRVQATLQSNNIPFGYQHLKATDNLFAYQFTAGLTYNFSENYAVNLAYRYIGTDRSSNLGKISESNLASAGVIYRFDNCYK